MEFDNYWDFGWDGSLAVATNFGGKVGSVRCCYRSTHLSDLVWDETNFEKRFKMATSFDGSDNLFGSDSCMWAN